MLDKLNNFLDATCENSNISSDEDQPSDADCISTLSHLPSSSVNSKTQLFIRPNVWDIFVSISSYLVIMQT